MNAISKMEATIAKVCGRPVELTVRGDREFTFSFDEIQELAADKLAKFFSSMATVTISHDDECGTCVYVDVFGR